VLNNYVDEVIADKYSDFEKAASPKPDYDVTLEIDKAKLPKLHKISKGLDEETKAKYKEENETIKEERLKVAQGIAAKIACFKRDYVGGPIYSGMKVVQKGGSFTPVEVPYRNDEKYWVFAEHGQQIQVIYGLNFNTKMERALARIMTIELKNTNGVATAPNSVFHDKLAERPDNLKAAFPGAAKEEYSNGMVSFGLNKRHLDKGLD